MNKRRTLIESITFAFISICIFISFSLSFYYISKWNVEADLVSTLGVAYKIFDVNDLESSSLNLIEYYKDYDKYRISLIKLNEEGKFEILVDSKGMTVLNSLESIELQTKNLNKAITRKSSYGYNMIYIAKNVENSPYFIRVAIEESSAMSFSRNLLIYGSIVCVLIDSLFITYKVYRYKKSIKPLNEEILRLNSLVKKEDSLINEEDDLTILTSSIDELTKEIEEKIKDLEKEKEKLNLVLDTISQGFIALDGNQNIILFNKAAREIFLLSEEKVNQKNYHILNLNEKIINYIDNLNFEKQDKFIAEFEKNGKIYKVDIKELPYFLLESQKSGVLLVFDDVSEERNIASIKADFFSNASHELKSPLTSILGYLELLKNGYLESEMEKEEALSKAIEETKRMKLILQDMLILNKIDNVKEKRGLEEINLKDIINDSLNGLHHQIEKKNLTLFISLEDYFISINKEDIFRMINNIIENAIKYNIDGHSISISLNKNKDELIIEDTGIGIKEENLSRIFERFYRVDNSRILSNIEGTGLGLAIVKHIANLYDFKINVYSTYGKGTKFVIKLK